MATVNYSGLGAIPQNIGEAAFRGQKEHRKNVLDDFTRMREAAKIKKTESARSQLGKYIGGDLGQIATQDPEMAKKAIELQSLQMSGEEKGRILEVEAKKRDIDQVAGMLQIYKKNQDPALWQRIRVFSSQKMGIEIPENGTIQNAQEGIDELQGFSGQHAQALEQFKLSKMQGAEQRAVSGERRAESVEDRAAKKFAERIPGGARKTIKDANDRLRYATGNKELVFPGIKIPQGKDTFEKASKLRKNFEIQSKTYIDSRNAYNRILASAENPSPAGDMSLIINYLKILDPNSVVKESEFAMVAATGSYGERVRSSVAKLITGEKLSPAIRKDFLRRSKQLFGKQEDAQKLLRSEYDGVAERAGINKKDVTLDYGTAEKPLDKAAKNMTDAELLKMLGG